MPQLELYENKILQDRECPIQLNEIRKDQPMEIFAMHWHEHLEMHFVFQGSAEILVDQKPIALQKGDLLIANSNELHHGFCTQAPYEDFVIIFDIHDLSAELAGKNYIFCHAVRQDRQVEAWVRQIAGEFREKQLGYKQVCSAAVKELLVYLCRNYVEDTLPERESLRRRKDQARFNTVLSYIERNYDRHITVAQLAEMACLSEDRFGHLFREKIGLSPLKYINTMRLQKAEKLLKTKEYTVTEVAETVGFQDYNHFSRQFRKQFGCAPGQLANETAPSRE